MGTAQLTFEEVVRGGPTENKFCACPDFFRIFFLTIVVQNVVQVPWLLDFGHVTPKVM